MTGATLTHFRAFPMKLAFALACLVACVLFAGGLRL